MTLELLAQTDSGTEDALDELASLTLQDWLWAGAIVLVGGLIAWGARTVLVRVLRDRAGTLVAKLIGRMVAFVVVALALVYALNQVGVSIGPLLGLLGLAGLALALALQDVLANFIAGVMISLKRPFRVGDEIGTSDHEGKVEDVSLRLVTLRTFDGVEVFIPNSTVWDEPLRNFTSLGGRRTELAVGVGYDTDLDQAQQILVDAMKDIEGIRNDPVPAAFVHEFGDSSINFAVRFWHEPQRAEEWQVRDELARRIKQDLDEAGIDIPFPQIVLHRAD